MNMESEIVIVRNQGKSLVFDTSLHGDKKGGANEVSICHSRFSYRRIIVALLFSFWKYM